MKILLAEDTQEIADAIIECLLMDGHEVSHANNGVKAKNFIRKHDFDLIICDHNMPRAFGNEVYDYLRIIAGKSTKFIHCSSAPCPEVYVGSDVDDNFVNCPKAEIIPLLEKLC